MNRISFLCAFFIACLVAQPGAAGAQQELVANAAFGSAGLVLTDLSSGSDEALAIKVLDDGRIVVAGSSDNGIDGDMAVVRYLPDGTIDPDFLFSAGAVIGAAFGDDVARAVVVLDDASLVLAGSITENGATSAVLVKLLENGQLDYRFGDQGITVFRPDGDDGAFSDLIASSDGMLVAAGASGQDSDRSPFIARFQADGSIDSAFGSDGIERYAAVSGELHGLVADAAGTIFACGYARDDNDRTGVLLVRLSNGAEDAAFGENGVRTVFNDNEQTIAHDIALQRDGRLVIAGEARSADDSSSVLIGRFSPDGSPDQDLSENGLLVYDIGQDSAAYAIGVQADNSVLAAGYRQGQQGRDLIVLRFDAELTPDDESAAEAIKMAESVVEVGSSSQSAAAQDGTARQAHLVTTAVEGSDETGLALAIEEDGTVFTAGSSESDDQSVVLVASYTAVASTSGASATPVFSTFYAIETVPVTAITRVGALTGGEITTLDFDAAGCLDACLEQCTDTETTADTTDTTDTTDMTDTTGQTTTCQASCSEQCAVPTVEKRGVVYSVDPLPTYDDSETSDTTDTTDGTDTTDAVDDDDDSSDNPFAIENFFDLEGYLVKKGQTDDGSGAGAYDSHIEEVNPQTVYYVRAYAVLSDGSVIYGNQLDFRTEDACFIATAAFGSVDSFAVQTLRQFRDRYLKPYQWGRALISAYYRVSPPLADLVDSHPLCRVAVLWLLLPVVAVAIVLVYIPLSLPFLPAAFLSCFYMNRFLIRKYS